MNMLVLVTPRWGHMTTTDVWCGAVAVRDRGHYAPYALYQYVAAIPCIGEEQIPLCIFVIVAMHAKLSGALCPTLRIMMRDNYR